MSEGAKTLTFVGVAVGLLIVAVATQPRAPSPTQAVAVGKTLNEVEDPLSATRLQVIRFNEDTSSLSDFEVAQVDGVWVIPSHQDYPADAEQHMADAAMSVMNLQILGVATTNRAEHATFGAIDPDVEKLKPGTVGVGTRVTMQDETGEQLVNMIIGKEVKDQQGQRYVRDVGRDPVYVVKIDPEKLTTRFEDWIEKDLLKINPYDIAQVTLKDYSVELGLGATGLAVQWDRRGEMTFAYNDTDSKWTADDLKMFDLQKQAFETVTLAADEEVNTEKLNDLKNALGDLKIVDVERKPEGLSQDLKAGKGFATDQKAVQNLAQRGFMPVQVGDAFDILSTDGEVLCQMKDGVEYVLRFGKLVLGTEGAGQEASADKEATANGDEAKAEGETKDAASDESGSGINRYLFVTTRFNPNAIPRPKIEKLPELPEGAAAKEVDEAKPETGQEEPSSDPAGQGDAAATPETESDAQGATETTPATDSDSPADANSGSEGGAATDADTSGSGAAARPAVATRVVLTAYQANDQDSDAADDATAETVSNDAAAEGATAAADESTAAQAPAETVGSDAATAGEAGKEESADAKAADGEAVAEGAAAGTAAADEKKESETEADQEGSELDALIARRKEIETENQRKLDEYNEKTKKGKERVKELNQRFGDWYYVISDTVFAKIHLGRDAVIKEKEKEEDQADAGNQDAAKTIVPAGPAGQLDVLQRALNQESSAAKSDAAAAEGTQGKTDETDARPAADDQDAAGQADPQEAAGTEAAVQEEAPGKDADESAGDDGSGPDLGAPGK
jgi:hypothetical protein